MSEIGRLSWSTTSMVVYFPTIDQRLIEALAEQFPDQCPELTLSEKEVWYKSGQASVVRWLLAKSEEQQDDVYHLEVV